ncbi:non-ribosomal peptide synthetase [Streptomyces sp. NBRC 109706]|uniref:non-ribosomal peptide synthetase n=1 Tax=Streptomyces sp. NBRC 109706 TaxID=1550035 RepID=UPI0007812F1B|nr:non-ribosomal peptide synthetase [Streptomyces sp. NBRC 109706]
MGHRGQGVFERYTGLSTEGRAELLAAILRDPLARRRVAPSAAQRRMWFLHRAGLDRSDYNAPAAYLFRGPLDVEALRRAFAALCRRHRALASRFVDAAGEPLVLTSAAPPPFRYEELRGTARGSGREPWRPLVDAEARRPFELAGGPLARCLVVASDPDEFAVVITAHHTVVDGWSLGVLLRDLSALYRAETGGAPVTLPELAHDYQDFVAWQEERLGGEGYARAVEHLTARLAGAPAVLDLPADRPPPPRPTLRGGTVTATLPAELTGRLGALGRRVGATSFMAHQALYAATLAHHSGQRDLLIGVPYAGRERHAFASVVGNFVNTVVLRADLSGDPSFHDLLTRTRRDAIDAYRHAAVPFDRLVEALDAPRAPGRNPLFQAFFAHEPAGSGGASGGLELGGVVGEPLVVERTTTALDLDLHVGERPDGTVELALTHALDLVDPTTARRLLRHLTRLAVAAAAAPDTPLGDLPLLPEAERAALLGARQPALEPAAELLHRCVEGAVAAHPDAVAAKRGAERLSYRALDASANRLARRLRAAGVGPEVPVGVCLSRGPALLVAILAVLKAGGGYVPMEATLSDERLATLVADTRMPVLVTDDRHLPRHTRFPGRVVSVDDAALAALPASPPPVAVGPANMAYIMYTSGSTGSPKGVVVEHRQVVRLVEFYRSALEPEEVSGVLASTPVGFDATIQEYFATLLLGGTVLFVDSVFDLRTLPERESVTLVQGVPSLLQELLAGGPLPGGVTTVMLSGEPLPGELVERLYASGSVKRVYNVYGVTECTADASWCLVERGTRQAGLGEPLPGMRRYVLDARHRPVPVGARGELYLAGPGLSRGYLGREELTGERFPPDPFVPGERMYRTGDLVRYRADGQLVCLGRVDRQIKVNGCRVEPAEVEAALRAHPAVDQAAVVAHRVGDDNRLAAYVVLAAGRRLPRDLRRSLARRLPPALVPSTVTALDALPLNANGKLDTRALPRPRRPQPSGPAAPGTPAEERLLAIWRRILGREDFGVSDDFFALGGQSLTALRMTALVKAEFGVEPGVAALFEAPTVAELAALLGSSTPGRGGGALVELRAGVGTPMVLVHAVGGGVVGYADLCAAFSSDRPVFGVEAEGLTGGGPPPDDVGELAGRYLDRLDAGLGAGPVVLAGWSMGGLVAYEMAARARERGRDVEALVLVDTAPEAERAPVDEAELAALHSRYLAAAAGLDAGLTAREARGRPMAALLDWARARGVLGQETSIAELRRIFDVFAANLRAFDAYRPTPLRVPSLLVAARAGDPAGRGAAFRALLGDSLTVEVVDGDHHTVLRPPHCRELAGTIERWLAADHPRTGPNTP